jgi:hypothetical protein
MEEKELEQLESTKKLTAKQELFCQEYIQCLNQTTAYQKAYQCENRDSARKNAARLMTNEVVRKRVEELKAEIVERYQLTREQVVDMAMNVYLMAKDGKPEMKLNRDGKFVPTGNKEYDFRAMNDAVKNIASMCGFNVQQVKAEVQADVKEDVNIITAKDIATELMKK